MIDDLNRETRELDLMLDGKIIGSIIIDVDETAILIPNNLTQDTLTLNIEKANFATSKLESEHYVTIDYGATQFKTSAKPGPSPVWNESY